MKQSLLIVLVILCASISNAQVGIGTSTPNVNAMLDVTSNSKGFLPPRMSTSQRMAMVNPQSGMIVFDDTERALYVYIFFRGWQKVLTGFSGTYGLPTDVSSNPGAATDRYGTAVSIGTSTYNNGLAVAGAPGVNNKEGSANIFGYHNVTGKWIVNGTLSPTDLLAGDHFGYAVAADRLNASTDFVIAAPFSTEAGLNNAGSIYFYDHLGLKNQAFAPAARQVANAKFGRSVDIAGNSPAGKGFAIVGAPGANAVKGEAYIYEYNPNSLAWEHRATLTDNLGVAADSFGLSVAIHYKADADTGWAFVGAPYDEEGGVARAGSVTAFRKAAGSTLWTRVAKFTVVTNTFHGLFGYALAPVMSCGKVLVTAPHQGGRVYEWTLDGLAGNVASFSNIALPSTATSSSGGMGVGVSISAMPVGNNCDDLYVAVGSGTGYLLLNSNIPYGSVSLFNFNGNNWQTIEAQMLDANGVQANAGFGRAVSLNSNRRAIFIGAPNHDLNGNNMQGKVQMRVF